MTHHVPNIHTLSAEVQLMYLSRHIYLLAAALVNLVSALSSLLAFISEPPFGFAGRGWRSYAGMIALFAGVMAHLVASIAQEQ
jgi:hypothetical protein